MVSFCRQTCVVGDICARKGGSAADGRKACVRDHDERMGDMVFGMAFSTHSVYVLSVPSGIGEGRYKHMHTKVSRIFDVRRIAIWDCCLSVRPHITSSLTWNEPIYPHDSRLPAQRVDNRIPEANYRI